MIFALLVLVLLNGAHSLDNGLALSPPMGWLSWQRFRCNTDCVTYPESCISQQLYMDMADALVNQGFATAGYDFGEIAGIERMQGDDC